MSEEKEKWYRVTVTFKNGHTAKYRIKGTKKHISDIFEAVDKCWQKEFSGGYLNLSNTYMSMNEIVTYKIQFLRFRWF